MENATLKLRGMSCASSTNTIEQAMRSVPGMSECVVNFGAEQVSVTYDPQQTDIQALQTAVDEAGYIASPIEHDTFTREDDEGKTAQQAENRDLTRKVWAGGIISIILLVGSLSAMLVGHLLRLMP